MIGAIMGLTAAFAGLLLTGPVHEPVILDIDSLSIGEGVVTQVLNVRTSSDWTAAAVVIDLSTGSIIQDRHFTSVDQADARALTWPTTAMATGPEAFGKTVMTAGACDENLGGETPRLDAQRMDLCWYNLSPDDVGWGSIGRFTFTSDAVGRWTLAVTQAGGNQRYCFGGSIILGQMVIAPWPD